jgi:putative oxidoreductase
MLASMFVWGGLDAVRRPEPKADAAQPIAGPIAAKLPGLPETDPVMLVRINGAVMVAAGAMLALGRLPRLAALALAGSLVPTTLAGHRFWEYDDPGQRSMQTIQFLKNVSMLGGLLIVAADTGGKPSMAWRVRHAREHAQAAAHRTRRQARREARHVGREAKLAARGARARLSA